MARLVEYRRLPARRGGASARISSQRTVRLAECRARSVAEVGSRAWSARREYSDMPSGGEWAERRSGLQYQGRSRQPIQEDASTDGMLERASTFRFHPPLLLQHDAPP